ncbi:MAG TPA: EVE domain-containing protein [Candidatus Binatia bacterium]
MANRWLVKTEPSVYSYQQLVKEKRTVWDGVKNNLALKHMKGVKKGDWVMIYHTGKEKAAVGIARAVSGAHPDPKKNDARFLVFDVEAVKPLPRPVTLAELKGVPKLASFDLLRLSRLSVMPVSDDQWKIIVAMGDK